MSEAQQPAEEQKSQTPEEQRELIKNFLEDPKNKLQAAIIAEQINLISKERWFTIEALSKKSNIPIHDLTGKVILLGMAGLCLSKKGENGTKHAGLNLYRIVLTAKAKILQLENMMAYHEAQLVLLSRELDKVIKEEDK